MSTPQADPRRWWALLVLAGAQFMVIMDTSIIGVSLPEMQRDLGFSPSSLQWVFNAYVIAFGGLLLLGGRLSDLLGARRVFTAGWVTLIAGSVLAAAAETAWVELLGRAVQGAGGALIAPSAMTAVATAWGAERLGDPAALTDGFQAAFVGAGAVAVAGAVLGFALMRPQRPAAARPEADETAGAGL